MKMDVTTPWWQRMFPRWKRAAYFRLLQQQRLLLQKGTETTAEIIDAAFFEDKTGSLLPMRLWVKLKIADGSFIYTHVSTVVNYNQVPGKGATVKIKYLPGNFSSILIMPKK